MIYVSSLHIDLPRGVTHSYIDDFNLTAASLSYRTNIRILQRAIGVVRAKARAREVDFQVPKTELMHWRTPKQRDPPNTASPPNVPRQASLLPPSMRQMARLLVGLSSFILISFHQAASAYPGSLCYHEKTHSPQLRSLPSSVAPIGRVTPVVRG